MLPCAPRVTGPGRFPFLFMKSLRAPAAWVVYDLANTLYSAIVVTFLINPYVEDLLRGATYAAAANFLSMVAAGTVAPAFGEVTDQRGTSKRWLVVTTLVSCSACIAMTAFHFVGPGGAAVWLILLSFAAANFCYQLSLVFYNSLLPGLVPEERIGFWSGIGVGLGYLGIVLGMGALGVVFSVLDEAPTTDRMAAGFGLAGVLFLVLSLPLFAFVRERAPLRRDGPAARVAMSLKNSLRIWARNLRDPLARRFLVGNFFLTDVLNTTIFEFSLYCVKVFDGIDDVTDPPLRTALVVLSLAALVLGVVCGKLTDRVGAKPALVVSALSLGVCLGAGVLLPPDRFSTLLWFLASFGAFGLAGIWTAGRALLVRIAPRERIGEYFGMYGLSLKVSVLGAILFGLIADHLPVADAATRYRYALASGLLPLVLGLWAILGLRVPR